MQTVIKIIFSDTPKFYRYLVLVLVLCAINLSTAYSQTKQIDSLAMLLKQHPDQDDRRGTLLFELSTQWLHTDPKKAIPYLDQVISFQNKIKYKAIVASSYRVKGVMQYLLAMYPEALVSLNEAYRLDKLYKLPAGEAGDRANMGMVYLALSNMPRALTNYLAAAKIFSTIKGPNNEATTVYANIGIIYMQMNDFDKATEHFIKTRDIYKHLNNKIGEANALGNMAIIASKKKDYHTAVTYSKMALKLHEEVASKLGIARETGNLSGYYGNLGQFDEGIKLGLKAAELNKALSQG
ncbi:MAG: tetratricopeptide repeat protein, partial [Sphingobacteriaceae bacterium]